MYKAGALNVGGTVSACHSIGIDPRQLNKGGKNGLSRRWQNHLK
jgi:hypothetical protein